MKKEGWVKKKLGEVCDIINGKNQKKVLDEDGPYPIYGSGGIMGYANDYLCKGGTTIIGRKGSINNPIYVECNFWNVDTAFGLQPKEQCQNKFLYYLCKSIDFTRYDKSVTIPSLVKSDLLQIAICIPRLPEQQQIVSELDCFQGIIDKKKEQLQELDKLAQSIFYTMFGQCKSYTALSNYISSLNGGKSLASEEDSNNKVLKTSSVSSGFFKENEFKNLPYDYIPRIEHKVNVGDLLISRMNTPELVGTCAYVWHVKPNVFLPDRLWKVTLYLDKVNSIFLWFALRQYSIREQIKKNSSGTSGSMKNISKSSLLKIKIHEVPLVDQQEFADKITAIEQQKARIQQSLQDTETLFNSRMDYYFG